MVLSDCTIREFVKSAHMIEPFCEDQLQAASYDITASEIAMIFKSRSQPIDLQDKVQMERAVEEINISAGYYIKPGEYILVKTQEKFNIPGNVTAHTRPRTTFTRAGLVLSDQHMNPGFCGRLYLGLYNATPNIMRIRSGLQVGQMVFEEIHGNITTEKLYNHKPDAKYQDEDKFRAPSFDELTPEDQEAVRKLTEKMLGKQNV